MWNDPIIDEIHKIRERHAAKFNYDLKRMAEDVKRREQQSGRKIIPAPPPPTSGKKRKRA